MPGGHAALVDHLTDHLAPAGDLVVAGHGKRTDPALAMALDAMVLKDPGNLIAIGYLGIGDRLTNAADLAADQVSGWHADLFAGQELADGLGQVAALGPRALIADAVGEAVLIVDAAVIPHHAVSIEHKHLGGALRQTDRPPCCRRL